MAEKLVQFLVIADGELKMTRNDTGLLVITGSVTSQLEDFGSKILKNGSEVDRGTSTNTRFKSDLRIHKSYKNWTELTNR